MVKRMACNGGCRKGKGRERERKRRRRGGRGRRKEKRERSKMEEERGWSKIEENSSRQRIFRAREERAGERVL